ncbi:SgcJ/EcaC family oxidoreductase [Nonomuraea mesophila]|uniref:SgcJ/EcaC family oxidoreductase n=2 Tax=Nonomuraea mesophila TaxID=2530382 RepID=A0A4R5E6D8_9ACTN|nr:SgcJ/EcaC family oxidoreductase [Nonomuraea mesophila]
MSLRVVIATDPTSCGAKRSGIVSNRSESLRELRRRDMNPDIEAIEQVVRDAEDLQSDVAGFTGLLTEEATLVNFTGIRLRGRDQVRQVMAKALRTPLKDVLTKNELLDVTFLRPDVALANLVKHVNDGRTGALTFVLVKDDGTWRIALAQTTPVVTS